MAVRDDFAAGEVLAAADLNDTFASKLDIPSGTNPNILFTESDAATDNQKLRLNMQSGNLAVQALTDAGTGGGATCRFDRTGNLVDGLSFVSGGSIKNFISTSGGSYFTSGDIRVGTSTDAVIVKQPDGFLSKIIFGDEEAGNTLLQYNRNTGTFLIREGGTGGVVLSSGGTSWASASDETMKDITSEIDNASDAVRSLRAVRFTWKHDDEETPQVGLIAQDVQAVLPEAVDEAADGTLMLRYSDVIPLLVGAMKEQADQIDALTARLDAAGL